MEGGLFIPLIFGINACSIYNCLGGIKRQIHLIVPSQVEYNVKYENKINMKKKKKKKTVL